MANQKMLALVFALAVSAAHADNCEVASTVYELKDIPVSYTTLSCPSNTMTCSRSGSWGTADFDIECDCAEECCEAKSSTCYSVMQGGGFDNVVIGTGVCLVDRTNKLSESSLSRATTLATFDADCCVAKPLCSAMSSCTTAGMMKNAAMDAVKCNSETCTDAECCMIDPAKCLAVGIAGNTCGADREADSTKNGMAATAATYDANCCKSATCATLNFGNNCLAGRTSNTDSATTSATAATYDAVCCKAIPTPAQCGSITCTSTAGYMDNPAKTATSNCFTSPCTVGECCLMDPTKCLGFRAITAMTAAQDCDTANPPLVAPGSFIDANKFGAAVANVAGYAAACCTARATCASFKSHSYAGSASGAEQMYKPAASLLVLVTGTVLAFTQ